MWEYGIFLVNEVGKCKVNKIGSKAREFLAHVTPNEMYNMAFIKKYINIFLQSLFFSEFFVHLI